MDEGERFVPFIMHGPCIRKGVKVDGLHSLVSVAPTMSYLLGAPFPNKARGPVLTEAIALGKKGETNEEMHRSYSRVQ